ALRHRGPAEPAAGRCAFPDLCQPRPGVLTMGTLRRVARIFAAIACGLVLLVLVAFGALQTRSAKLWLAGEAAAALSGDGTTARVGAIEGLVPFDMRLA